MLYKGKFFYPIFKESVLILQGKDVKITTKEMQFQSSPKL